MPTTHETKCLSCKKYHDYDEFPVGTRVRATADRRGLRVTLVGDVGVVTGQTTREQLLYHVDFEDGTSGVMAPCEIKRIS